MSRKSKKPRRPKEPGKPAREAKPRIPWEWITVSSACLVVGLMMTFARSGRVVPLPADHSGPEPTVAAMNAPDMRVYGVFTLLMGLGMAGLAWHQWKHPVPDDDAEA
jgi:hypothetical protein